MLTWRKHFHTLWANLSREGWYQFTFFQQFSLHVMQGIVKLWHFYQVGRWKIVLQYNFNFYLDYYYWVYKTYFHIFKRHSNFSTYSNNIDVFVFHINGIICYAHTYVWFILINMFVRIIYIVLRGCRSLIPHYLNRIFIHMNVPTSIYPFKRWMVLGYFEVWCHYKQWSWARSMSFGKYMRTVLLGMYLRRELLNHSVCIDPNSIDIAKWYFKVVVQIYSHICSV